ncbi:hypothetical protein BH11MYX1_BH11MYX1_22900 [soil metagenome]
MDAPLRAPAPQEAPVVRADDLRRPPPNRPGRPIDVILRSSPPAAEASVDGVAVGPTPAYWSGMADGREHEFVFVLPGHAVARYRFVPITSGVIHARLEAIIEDVDAAVPMPTQPPGIPAIAPTQSPLVNAPAPVPSPPTVLEDAGDPTGLGPHN